MNYHPKMKALIEKLHHQTLVGEIDWRETEEEGVYQVAFPSATIRVSERPAKMVGGNDISISIYNARGELIDEVFDYDMDEESDDPESPDILMGLVYQYARRAAMNVEDTLSSLLDSLGGDTERRVHSAGTLSVPMQ